ncbi:methionyl-tRNA formyltransferase [uncultured Phycicoccus sp.]|uniref:methionyl-tRNA formyltransferase n=1 Tax=uncultured Phycicoccus sp. TaxID=661422 RepID=UPI0026085EDB|nr:methionyl-tRNA formyltransferase [uncultured Phycicoccus sp.]
MRLVLAGTPATALPSLRALLASRHEVAAVVTRPDARSGRGRALAPSPVKEVALEHGLEVLTPGTPRDPDFLDRLRTIAPDCCPVVAYGALLPPVALEVPVHGWVNLHFSLLPAWRGAAPVQRALMAGDEVTGASTFVIDEGLDTGPVLGAVTETVRPDDTAGSLLGRLADVGAGLLVATMDGLEDGALSPVPQPADGVSHAPKLSTEEAEVRWGLPSHVVDRHIRGCTPHPGAWTVFRDERLKVGPVDPAPAPPPDCPALAPGHLHPTKRAVFVGTASGPVVLGEVRPHGKKPMAAADWARGVRIGPGERLG